MFISRQVHLLQNVTGASGQCEEHSKWPYLERLMITMPWMRQVTVCGVIDLSVVDQTQEE
jgi:hypothetical protein